MFRYHGQGVLWFETLLRVRWRHKGQGWNKSKQFYFFILIDKLSQPVSNSTFHFSKKIDFQGIP